MQTSEQADSQPASQAIVGQPVRHTSDLRNLFSFCIIQLGLLFLNAIIFNQNA